MHVETLKNEVERLCKLGVLKKVNRSEWAAPTFIIPKKDGTVRFISDFRELNKRIRRKPFPMPGKTYGTRLTYGASSMAMKPATSNCWLPDRSMSITTPIERRHQGQLQKVSSMRSRNHGDLTALLCQLLDHY